MQQIWRHSCEWYENLCSTYVVVDYAPVKVNPAPGIWQGSVWPYRGLWQQQFFSDILILQMQERYIFCWYILTVKTNSRVGILTDKHFLHQKSLGQPGRGHRMHINMCIKITPLTIASQLEIECYLIVFSYNLIKQLWWIQGEGRPHSHLAFPPRHFYPWHLYPGSAPEQWVWVLTCSTLVGVASLYTLMVVVWWTLRATTHTACTFVNRRMRIPVTWTACNCVSPHVIH